MTKRTSRSPAVSLNDYIRAEQQFSRTRSDEQHDRLLTCLQAVKDDGTDRAAIALAEAISVYGSASQQKAGEALRAYTEKIVARQIEKGDDGRVRVTPTGKLLLQRRGKW